MALAPRRPGPERTVTCGGGRLGRRRARRRPARGHPRRRGGNARGRRADVPDGGPDQLGGLDDRARRSGSDLHPAVLRQFASDYLAGADPRTPLASPLFASLSGLPPLLIQVGTADLCSAIPSAWPRPQLKPGSTSRWRPARAFLTSTRSCSAPRRQPKPPRKSVSSCGLRFGNQAACGGFPASRAFRQLTLGRAGAERRRHGPSGDNCPGDSDRGRGCRKACRGPGLAGCPDPGGSVADGVVQRL